MAAVRREQVGKWDHSRPSEYFWLIGLGLAVGLFGTLIGAGGGFVLMPILLLLYPRASPEELTAISLAVVFFNALAGSEAYAFMGRIDYKSGLIFAAATIPGAVIGALNTSLVPRHLFNGIFGILLIGVAIFLVLRPEIKPRSELHAHRGHAWRIVTTPTERGIITISISTWASASAFWWATSPVFWGSAAASFTCRC